MTALIQFLPTPDGPFGVLVDEDGRVLASGWTDSPAALLARLRPDRRPAGARSGTAPAVADAVEAYYSGEHAAIDAVPVRQDGGPFRTEAWVALRRIAPGRPLTYTQFATAAGRPSAVRAAASACATNAVALFVPCHRVLRTDGSLGGFAWGTAVKASLLAREAVAA
ncbi:methylated-DNA--[protein]-cysteine S-methyltransferase [Naasia sp. SYSU D00948]|uniref:methylated-DNA--[protein]-cysteine S-methyltransferase n=1 Tax=Naasia sp. SYSU D00948 TaxID=2817379 RepID=UPI001B302D5E|nr:methylated-DNA--[protein]-cysteine S-methyltransferase [Naasia sp. SYSU D00948]